MDTILICGRPFKVSKDGYICAKSTRLHRVIWESQFGPIPQGFDIHHKDGNKLNNKIENLECVSHKKHLQEHMTANKEKVHAWHKTEEGRKKLGQHAKEVWENREVFTLSCEWCGSKFEAKQKDRARYCNNKCEQAARRARGDDLVDRTCVICGKSFRINKYHKTQTCGYACGSKYRLRNRLTKKT